MALIDHKGFRRGFPAAILLIAAVAAYGAMAYQALLHGPTSPDEVANLIRAWWYTSGVVKPYTATDATWSMPLYFFQLGWWQHLVGVGQFWGRAMSIGIGVLNGVLLFAICNRLTANSLASAGAVFVFLATPATSFIFASATPAATVSLLHLGAIWLIVTGLGRPRPWATVLLGLLLVALYFYRQNMILAAVVLGPLYIAGIGRKRALHAAVLIVVMALATAALLYAFPHKLAEYAVRLPLIYGWLADAHLLSPNFVLIDRGATAPVSLDLAFNRFAAKDVYDFFLLPYGGTVILALALLAVVSGPLRILWAATLYFVWMIVTHLIGSLGFCRGCMVSYTPYFVGVGAVACALTLAMLARWARQRGTSPALAVIAVSVLVVTFNTFAPAGAFDPANKLFPLARVVDMRATAMDAGESDALARWVAANAPQREPILLIPSRSDQRAMELPYAAFLAGHLIPPQSFDLARTHRVINAKLPAAQKEAVQAAIEEESLWSDETMKRWIEREYDLVIIQDDKTPAQTALLGEIAARFDQAGATTFRGASLLMFKRKPAQ